MITLRELLCATDVEQPARTALNFAFFIAERFHASLSVVHARQLVHESNLYVPAQKRFEQLAGAQRLRARLDALVRAITRGESQETASTYVVDGKLVEAVVACSARQQSNLIVLGASAHSRAASSGGEGLAERIGHLAWCPVLTVPHGARASAPRLRHILLPLDRPAPMNGDAIAWAAFLAARFGAIVELMGGGDEASDHEAEEALRVAGVGFEPCTRTPRSALADCILKRIERGDCDLVVMSTRPRGVSDFSVLANVRRRCLVPILSVRSKGPDRRFVEDPAEEAARADERCTASACARPSAVRETAQS